MRARSWDLAWRAAVAAAVVAGVAGLAAGVEGGDPAPQAPLRVWAAGHVRADGSLLVARGIDGARRVGVGVYCVHIANPYADLTHSVLMVVPAAGDELTRAQVSTRTGAGCGDGTRTVSVRIVSASGRRCDEDFDLAVL